ncbi:fumarylacetoacetate hydrolase family protein [Enterobacter hormaechei]
MKGTVFAVALNHQSQRAAWLRRLKSPHNAPPKTAVWFIKPHNTVIRAGEPIPFHRETVLSGATVALVVGKTASKVRVEEAAAYIAGYALANEISLPEESFYRPGDQGQMSGWILPARRTCRR